MTAAAYDEIAAWYDDWVGPVEDDPFFAQVETFLGEVAGQRLCDLGCGQGRVARYLADRGASVTGIDLSAKLLEIARRHEETDPRGITYLHADARSLDNVADSAFDGVICHLALMDIPDLPPTLRTVARILRPGGRFVFSILHPCYNTPLSGEIETPEGIQRTVARYFAEGYWRSDSRTGPPGKVGAYHRTLSAYVNTLTDAGLILERLSEVQATGDFAARRPVWAEAPAVLVARCRREAQ
ncbi:MAG TPA: class I SAM-dependent methyltransferase [Chthonomonadaceae bacterium]|nr:class I SAM-dependent methyltransferase [Chthonomonadaceae bacterium]